MRGPDLAVLGLGYVGLPLAFAASQSGLAVVGYDPDASKVDGLRSGRSHVDDIGDADVAAALQRGFRASTDREILRDATAYSICVPTPLADGRPNLAAVISAAQTIAECLQPRDLVVLESTSHPGTTDEVVQPILERGSGLQAGRDFSLVFSPERIDPGNRTWTLHNTPKIIGGDPVSVKAAEALYGKFCEELIVVNGTREAELSKLIENAYRLVNIAFVNELARVGRRLGVDVTEAIRAASTKPFGFQRFDPGPGIGGHCIPVDPVYLSQWASDHDAHLSLVDLALDINNGMPGHVVDRAIEIFAARGMGVAGAEVLLLGVSYKPGVGDTRETPATPIVRILREAGARVSYADPYVPAFDVDAVPVDRVDDPLIAAKGADLIIVLTAHPGIELLPISEAADAVLDTRGVLPPGVAWQL